MPSPCPTSRKVTRLPQSKFPVSKPINNPKIITTAIKCGTLFIYVIAPCHAHRNFANAFCTPVEHIPKRLSECCIISPLQSFFLFLILSSAPLVIRHQRVLAKCCLSPRTFFSPYVPRLFHAPLILRHHRVLAKCCLSPGTFFSPYVPRLFHASTYSLPKTSRSIPT